MKNKYSDNLFFQSKLQAFAAGELKGEALQELKTTIAQSTEAADEAHFSKKLAQALQHEDKLSMNALLAAIIAEKGLPPELPKNEARPNRTKANIGLYWASIIVLFFVVGGIFIYRSSVLNEMKVSVALYEHNFAPLENVIVTPETRTGLELFDRGMAAYDRGDFVRAAGFLDRFYQQSGDPNAALFLGVAQLELGNQEAAINSLQNCLGNLASPALDASQWYLALAYLKNGDMGLASEVLKTISAESVYGSQAASLLKEIKKPGN